MYPGSDGGVKGVERAGKIGYTKANANIISIPTHQVGKLLLKTAKAELILSQKDPALSATKAPTYNPIIDTIIVDVVNNKTVRGIFSIIISRTLEEPESLVKKLDFPRSSVITLIKVLKNLLGEYQGSSIPRVVI